jgi:hypothetical protein
MSLVGRIYAERIVNVNVNIIVAGTLAMLLTLVPVHFTRGVTDNHWAVWGVTVGFDVVFDVAIYYLLHWLANHLPRKRRRPKLPGVTELSFLRDASLVQFERAMLGPIYYGVFSGVQLWTLHRDWEREWTTVAGIGSALLTTRVLHTMWMLKCRQRGWFGHGKGANCPIDPTLNGEAAPPPAGSPSSADPGPRTGGDGTPDPRGQTGGREEPRRSSSSSSR